MNRETGIDTYRLSNGLRVGVARHPGARMAAVNVYYGAGGHDDPRAHTGLAHLAEHVMFGPTLGVKSFDQALHQAGGRSNAFTSADYTNYYDILPVHNLETALWLESRRMLLPADGLETFSVQRSVVVEEFKQQCLNVPYGDLGQYLLRALYPDPLAGYAVPVIGSCPQDIESITSEDMRQWYDLHYNPANAVLTVCADAGLREVRQMVDKWFGDIPEGKPFNSDYAPDAVRPIEDVTLTVSSPKVPAPRVVLAWRMDGRDSPQYVQADLLTDILSDGRAATLWRMAYGQNPPFVAAEASICGNTGPGYLVMTAMPTGQSQEDVIKTVDALMRIAQGAAQGSLPDLNQHSLQRSINHHEAKLLTEGTTVKAHAQSLAYNIWHCTTAQAQVELRRATSLEDIITAARDIFSGPCVRLVYENAKT